MAAMGILGAVLCALSPAWGAHSYHGLALGSLALGAVLAFAAATSVFLGTP